MSVPMRSGYLHTLAGALLPARAEPRQPHAPGGEDLTTPLPRGPTEPSRPTGTGPPTRPAADAPRDPPDADATWEDRSDATPPSTAPSQTSDDQDPPEPAPAVEKGGDDDRSAASKTGDTSAPRRWSPHPTPRNDPDRDETGRFSTDTRPRPQPDARPGREDAEPPSPRPAPDETTTAPPVPHDVPSTTQSDASPGAAVPDGDDPAPQVDAAGASTDGALRSPDLGWGGHAPQALPADPGFPGNESNLARDDRVPASSEVAPAVLHIGTIEVVVEAPPPTSRPAPVAPTAGDHRGMLARKHARRL